MKQVLTSNVKPTHNQTSRGIKHSHNELGTDHISTAINETIQILQHIASDRYLLRIINEIAKEIITAYAKGNKVLLCGNGGSAADAQHIAAELSGRFFFDRQPLSAEALHTNSSYLTAIANDYSFDEVFSRLVEAQGRPGDILIALSTSGHSTNIVKAVETGNQKGIITIGFTGQRPNILENLCDFLVEVPSTVTPRIQECHITIGHTICELVEKNLFSRRKPAVFLDRDGVINARMPEGDYVTNRAEFTFLPNVFEAVKLLNEKGYLVIVLAKQQQCMGKGIVTMKNVNSIHDKMRSAIKKHGAHIDAVYVCPHRIEENCSCKKPLSGLFERAVMDFSKKGISIDVSKSYMIGDSNSDVLAGKRAGLSTIHYDIKDRNCDVGLLKTIQNIINKRN
jgi:D-sedoheptulose 7-phosphate isomerase